MNKTRGFTLIEIMIVVAIIAILAAIAIPSYQSYLKKARRADAQSFMSTLATRQQQYLLDARAYAVDPDAVTTLGTVTPTSVANFYDITVTAGATVTPPSFLITAVPKGAQAGDGTLTLDSLGDKKRGTDPW